MTFLFVLAAHAGVPIDSPGNLGLGLGGGTHSSGVSAKVFSSQHLALQGVAGLYGAGRGFAGLGTSLDLLFEQPPLVTTDILELAWNVGPGVNLGLGDEVWLGAGGVAGLELRFYEVPVDIVVEYRPGLLILPVVQADPIGFGAHVRVYPF